MGRFEAFLRQRRVIRRTLKVMQDVASLHDLNVNQNLLQQEMFESRLLEAPRYQDPKRLTQHGAQVFSQNDEDGIIAEILRRIGVTNRVFVECGVGDGLECNTTYLLMKGWSGFWFEYDDESHQAITRTFRRPIAEGRLRVAKEFLTMESASDACRRQGVPGEFDVLSLDIDRNTSFLWRGLSSLRPRVVVVEYNASILAADDWEVEYDANAVWDGSLYYGASLKALERIGQEMGYVLVGCNVAGVNAFFVRRELAGNEFAAPFTAENHHEPPRHFLIRRVGHSRGFL